MKDSLRSALFAWRAAIGLALLALFLSFLCAAGLSIAGTGYFKNDLKSILFQTICLFPAWIIIVTLASYGRLSLRVKKPRLQSCSLPRYLDLSFTKRRVSAFSLLMMGIWAIWLIALFPGSMNWDTYYQISQCYPELHPIYSIPYAPTQSFVPNNFSDHHPILDTLIFGFFARSSDMLFGNWNLGVFAFVLLQSLATAFSFSLSIAYLEKLGASKRLRIALFAFFALMPFYPAYAATMVKDSLFSWLYVLFFLAIVHIARTRGRSLQSRQFVTLFTILGVLLALTKKPGIYVVLGTVLLLLFAYRHQIKGLITAALVPAFTIWILLPIFIFPALDVIPGGKQEALGPFFQQTARYIVEHGDDVTSEERDIIDRVLNYDTLTERYNPLDADPVKFLWNPQVSTSDLLAYAKVWFSEGLRHPDVYFEAWFANAAGYLSPTATIGLHENTGSIVPGESPLVYQPASLDGLRSLLLSSYHDLSVMPGIGIFFQIVLYSFWIPVLCFLAIMHRTPPRWLPVFIPAFMSIICCLITPLVHARYALPLIYTSPLLLALTLSICNSTKHGTGVDRIDSQPQCDSRMQT